MQASLDGTKCKDIASKEVRIKKKSFILSVAKKETDLSFSSNLKKKNYLVWLYLFQSSLSSKYM